MSRYKAFKTPEEFLEDFVRAPKSNTETSAAGEEQGNNTATPNVWP